MTKREYKVSRIHQESLPCQNKVTRKISILQYYKLSFIHEFLIFRDIHGDDT